LERKESNTITNLIYSKQNKIMTSNIRVGKDGLEKEIFLTSGRNGISDISECKKPTLLRKTYLYVIYLRKDVIKQHDIKGLTQTSI